jgi:hypothetical protein
VAGRGAWKYFAIFFLYGQKGCFNNVICMFSANFCRFGLVSKFRQNFCLAALATRGLQDLQIELEGKNTDTTPL